MKSILFNTERCITLDMLIFIKPKILKFPYKWKFEIFVVVPLLTPFTGGIFSVSGSKEFCRDCNLECIKRKEFRNLSLKLPHFSQSQTMVSGCQNSHIPILCTKNFGLGLFYCKNRYFHISTIMWMNIAALFHFHF